MRDQLGKTIEVGDRVAFAGRYEDKETGEKIVLLRHGTVVSLGTMWVSIKPERHDYHKNNRGLCDIQRPYGQVIKAAA